MLRLIDDLLDVASIEAGRLAIERGAHDAGPILHETLASFGSIAKEKRLRMTAEVQPNLPKANCDRDRILQVLSNLVGNATKVTAEGGQVTLRVEAREHALLFSVADDGPGIGDEDLKHLFERYWRSHDAGYKGTGLGLAIARGIVDAPRRPDLAGEHPGMWRHVLVHDPHRRGRSRADPCGKRERDTTPRLMFSQAPVADAP